MRITNFWSINCFSFCLLSTFAHNFGEEIIFQFNPNTLATNTAYLTKNFEAIRFNYLIFVVLLLVLLIVALIYIWRFRKKSRELAKVNSELNQFNSQLESIVESRTSDLLNTLKKTQDSDKLRAAFLANMSYEVRTPLNGIIGFTKLLNDDAVPANIRKFYLDMIAQRGRNLMNLINSIINISLLDTGQVQIKKVSFNLNQLLYDLYNVFTSNEYHLKNEKVALKLNLGLSDSRSNIVTDPIRIEQILTNLIDNAFKFTKEGIVEYGYEIVAGQSIKFFVKDTGPGIPDEQREKLFKRISKGQDDFISNKYKAGLGLPICRGLVDLLNGKIWVESENNKGTTFFFSIPYSPANAESKSYISRSSISTKSLNFKGKTILIVEDDLISFQFIEALLRNTEAKLIHVKNGEDAIDIVSMVSNIDLVVMDMRLPFIDGYEATARIKEHNPTLSIIAQTANVMSDDRAKCLDAGCDDYLPKPIDPDEFLRVVAHHLTKPKVEN